MKTEKFKVTPLERAWILYDVGNSAFVLMIATLVPIFFNALAEAGGGERILTGVFDTEALAAFREKFPAWRDADEFVLK